MLGNLLKLFSGKISLEEEPKPFIIAFLAKRLGYSPEKLAELFNDPRNKLNVNKDWNVLIDYWNETVKERIKLREKKEK